MQDYTPLGSTATTTVKEGILNHEKNINALRSTYSGTAFPTGNLVAGLKCYRTDLGKTYTYNGETWDDSVNTSSLTVSGETSVPTPSTTNNSKTIANTEFVHAAVSDLVNGAPTALDTLQELATALGNDPNFSTTILNKIGEKESKADAQIEHKRLQDAIPTKVSQLTNDAGYITKADITEGSTPDLTPYMKKSADSDLIMGGYRLIFPGAKVSSEPENSAPMLVIDTTRGSRGVNIKGPNVLVNGVPIATETDLSGKLDKTGTAAAAIKATQDGAGNVIATTYIKTINNLKPDDSGNINISTGGGSGSGVSTSTQNTWTAKQNFQHLKFNFESFATSRISGTYDSPATSVATYNVTGALTLDMSTLVGMISNGDTSIFTAYIASNGSYALSITNAGTLKYAGSAADLAITASGLLLNIFLTKNTSGVVTSIAQATKLS